MAMVVGVAVSNLQTVDMTLSRNMGIFGFSMMFGLIVPKYFKLFPVDTDWGWFNQILNVLLQMPMFVGALCACILDNSIGGKYVNSYECITFLQKINSLFPSIINSENNFCVSGN